MIHFTCLPAEIKLNVFAFLRLIQDRKNVCLVSHEWQQLMAPTLWETLSTNLQETSSRRLKTLLDPGNGILRYVRMFELTEAEPEPKFPELELVLLLGYLPRDRLIDFAAYGVTPSIVTWLLQKQSQLIELDVPLLLEPASPSDRVNMLSRAMNSWNIPSLAGISTLSVHVRPDEAAKTSYEPFRYLLTNTPRVENLVIWRDSTENYPSTGWMPSINSALSLRHNAFSPLVLKELELDGQYLGESSRALLDEVAMCRLEGLHIRRCAGLVPFLSALTSLFSRSGSKLKELNVASCTRGEDPLPILEALGSLLQIWRGLRKIVICMSLQHLVPKKGIIHHSDTLEHLVLGTVADGYQVFYNADIIEILGKCSELQEVAISLGPCYLGHWLDPIRNYHLEERDQHIFPSSPEAVLQTLSKLTKLRTLRMLDLPTIDYDMNPGPTHDPFNTVVISDEQVHAAQELMQILASDMLNFLVRRGSNVKVLNMRPYWYQLKRPVADKNQHRWPNYTYLTKFGPDGQGNECVIARPITAATVELPDARVLQDCG